MLIIVATIMVSTSMVSMTDAFIYGSIGIACGCLVELIAYCIAPKKK